MMDWKTLLALLLIIVALSSVAAALVHLNRKAADRLGEHLLCNASAGMYCVGDVWFESGRPHGGTLPRTGFWMVTRVRRMPRQSDWRETVYSGLEAVYGRLLYQVILPECIGTSMRKEINDQRHDPHPCEHPWHYRYWDRTPTGKQNFSQTPNGREPEGAQMS